jgi:cysteine desulfurase/selenocysteine lyase
MLRSSAISHAEVNKLRGSTPSATAFIHLNHASTSLLDESTIAAQRTYLEMEARVGAHRALEAVRDQIDILSSAIASLLGAQKHQIAITESASRGWALALSAVAPDRRLQAFVCSQEWGGNVTNMLSQRRVVMTQIQGEADDDWSNIVGVALERRDKGAVPIVSLPIIGSASGAIFNLKGVARTVRDAGGWLFVDASQAVGQLPVDVENIGADVLVFPARKWLRGPRGIAVLCLSDRALTQFGPPCITDLYGSEAYYSPIINTNVLRTSNDASRFQMYDYHPAVRLGLLAAVKAVQRIGSERIHDYTKGLCMRLFSIIGDRWPHIQVERPVSGLLYATMVDCDAADFAASMWQRNFNIAHVPARYAPLAFRNSLDDIGLLRFSPHVVTTEAEIDNFASAFIFEVEERIAW